MIEPHESLCLDRVFNLAPGTCAVWPRSRLSLLLAVSGCISGFMPVSGAGNGSGLPYTGRSGQGGGSDRGGDSVDVTAAFEAAARVLLAESGGKPVDMARVFTQLYQDNGKQAERQQAERKQVSHV